MNPQQHVVLDLPPQYKGGKPGRRCCVCHLSETLCGKFPRCNKRSMSVSTADQKTEHRRRKRHRR